MISKDKRMIQVVISNLTYEYLKKYSELFGVSISSYCNSAISEKIIKSVDVDNYVKQLKECI